MAASPETAQTVSADLLPKWFPWLVFFLTLASRVHYVTQPHNWWIVHPDEIYQSLEVAHGEMYGYGFRPFEFRPPDRTSDLPNIRQQELDHGMAALRSFLIPRGFYVTVTWLLELLGVSFTPFVVWKVAHAAVTSTLPLAVYRYVIAVFVSHDTACLAAVFCAVSTHLFVLGTHTLVNSLLAPPVFFALAHLHTLVTSSRKPTDFIQGQEQNGSCVNNTPCSVPSGPSRISSNGKHKAKSRGKHAGKNSHGDRSNIHRDVNFNRVDEVTPNGLNGKFTTGRGSSDVGENGHGSTNEQINQKDSNGNQYQKIVNGVTHSNHAQLSHAHLSSRRAISPKACAMNLMSNMAAGAVMGVCCYIRTDLIALVIATLVFHWRPLRTRYGDVVISACGTLGGVALGVWEDFRCYGWGVLTPLNWYRFNVENDYSTLFFGGNSNDVYVMGIFFQNYGMTILVLVSIICAFVAIFDSKRTKESKDQPDRTPQNWDRSETEDNSSGFVRTTARVTASWASMILLYSTKSHKELRFVHNAIVLVLITCAAVLHTGLMRLSAFRSTKLTFFLMGVACFAFSQWRDLQSLTDNRSVKFNKMAFKQAGDTQDVNVCLQYISQQNDVTGVFIDRNLYATAGYSILHKNVSIFSIFNNNFHEYLTEDRITSTSRNLIGPRSHVSLAYFSQFSNYVSLPNAQYVMKFVLEDPRYNYLIVLKGRKFLQFGFGEPVFRYGAFKVLKRDVPEVSARQTLLASKLEPVHNATILMHEADMLLWHGACRRAVERFKAVLRVDPGQVAAYSPMAFCYKRLGDARKFESTLTECYDRFGQAACERPRGLVKLK